MNRKPASFTMLLVGYLLACALQGAVNDPWIDPGYLRRIAITNLRPADPTQPLTDFPVLVAITNAGWLDPVRADGGDITFAGVDGKQLFHDIEYFGVDGGARATLQAWVCLPAFTNGTAFYMYWRNTASSLPFNGSNTFRSLSGSYATLNDGFIRSNAWDTNFLVVFHFSETSGMPKDATGFRCDATAMGTNISSNQPGIGIGTGNSMQTFNNTGWGGLYSRPQVYTSQNGPGWQGGYGVRVWNFTNSNYGHPATDRLYSNGASGGCLTHSMWIRYDDYPSNWYANVVLAGAGGKYTNFIPSTNYNTYAAIWGLHRAWGEPENDGYGVFTIQSTNGYPRWYYRQQGAASSAGRIIDTNMGPSGEYRSWFKYDQAVQMDYNPGSNRFHMRVLQNGVAAYTSTNVTPSAETTPTFRGLTLMGTSYEYIPVNYIHQKCSPKAYFDEYRLSAISRDSNWSVTEYSNVIDATNMSLLHGAQPSGLVYYRYAAITNAAPLMAQGLPFRGYVSAEGMTTARLVVSNSTPAEVYNQPVTALSVVDWSATPSLATGPHTAFLTCTNSTGAQTNSPLVSFEIRIPSTLTVKSVNSAGIPWEGGRVAGPSATPFPGDGIRTNDASGEVLFLNQLSGATLALTNFTPVQWGSAFLVTNFVMTETALTVVFTFDRDPPSLDVASGAGSSRLDPVYFLPSQSPFLRLSIPQAANASQRVIISAVALRGGKRTLLYDGMVAPSDPMVRIEASTVSRAMVAGAWILECRFPAAGQDESKARVTRRMMFFVQ